MSILVFYCFDLYWLYLHFPKLLKIFIIQKSSTVFHLCYSPRTLHTNNNVEGWHNLFAHMLCCAHPTVWKTLQAFLKDETLQRFKILKLSTGQPLPKNGKTEKKDEALKKIVTSYSSMTPTEYLNSVAMILHVNM